jgi:hypothetical protein
MQAAASRDRETAEHSGGLCRRQALPFGQKQDLAVAHSEPGKRFVNERFLRRRVVPRRIVLKSQPLIESETPTE